jgi:hypothetical protein
MANIKKIVGISFLLSAIGFGAYKGIAFYNKVKNGVGNITFNVSFLRVHGLIGDGLTKFISPTIRTLFNLNLKNFSGFNIAVTQIYARVETQKSVNGKWAVIATTNDYMSINLPDGKSVDKTLTIDFKGLGTIASLTNKLNRHRIVLTYNYKGQTLSFIQEVDLTSPISSFWNKMKNSFNTLKGTETTNAHLLY